MLMTILSFFIFTIVNSDYAQFKLINLNSQSKISSNVYDVND